MKKKLLYFAFILFTLTSVYSQEDEDYNFFDRPIENLESQIYMADTESWLTTSLLTFSYSSENVLISQLQKVYNFLTGMLEDTGRTTYIYDSAGQFIQDLEEIWNSSSEIWENAYRNEYTFNGDNRIETTLTYRWESNAWITDSRSFYTYNGAGNEIEYIDEIWITATSSWEPDYRTTYSYDSDGLRNEIVEYNWDSDNSSWEFLSRDTIERTGTTRTILSENYFNEEWLKTNLQTGTYDAEGFITEILDQDWDESEEDWVNETLRTRTKNSNNWVTEELIQSWEMGSWMNAAKIIFTYRDSSLALEDNSLDENLILYPNPASNMLNISNTSTQQYDLRIFSINGSEVQRERLSQQNKTVNISGLNKGVYLFEFRNDNEKFVRKIVKL